MFQTGWLCFIVSVKSLLHREMTLFRAQNCKDIVGHCIYVTSTRKYDYPTWKYTQVAEMVKTGSLCFIVSVNRCHTGKWHFSEPKIVKKLRAPIYVTHTRKYDYPTWKYTQVAEMFQTGSLSFIVSVQSLLHKELTISDPKILRILRAPVYVTWPKRHENPAWKYTQVAEIV